MAAMAGSNGRACLAYRYVASTRPSSGGPIPPLTLALPLALALPLPLLLLLLLALLLLALLLALLLLLLALELLLLLLLLLALLVPTTVGNSGKGWSNNRGFLSNSRSSACGLSGWVISGC